MCVVTAAVAATTTAGLIATIAADVAITAAVAGGVVGMVSSIQQSEAATKQAKYQAEVAEANALLAERQAERVDLAADRRRHALLMESQQTRGSARAGFASGGVVLASGTHLDYEADIAQTYDLDLKNLEYDVANRKWQARVQSANDTAQSELFAMQADAYAQKKTMTYIGGPISILGDTAKAVGSGLSTAGALK